MSSLNDDAEMHVTGSTRYSINFQEKGYEVTFFLLYHISIESRWLNSINNIKNLFRYNSDDRAQIFDFIKCHGQKSYSIIKNSPRLVNYSE